MITLFIIALISYLCLIVPSIPPIPGLLGLLLSVFLITLRKPSFGLVAISFAVSSYILVRWKSFDSILLAGFRSELFIIFVSACILRSFLSKDNLLRFHKDPIFFLFIFWVLLCFAIHSNFNKGLFLLAIRENLEAWLLLPFVISIFKRDIKSFKPVIYAFVFGCSFVALINIINYYELININIPSYVQGEKYIHERSLLGLSIRRMNPFLGIGPSGGGQYYTSVLIQACLLLFILIREKSSSLRHDFRKFSIILTLLLAIILLLTYASLLTASVASFASISLVLIALNSRLKIAISPISLFRRVVIIGIPVLFLLFVDLEIVLGITTGSSWDYFYDAFFSTGVNLVRTSSDLIVGNSLSLRTGGSLVASQGVIDVSWFNLIEKFGVPGFLLGILFTARYIYIYLSTSVKRHYYYLFMLAGVPLISLMSYSHSSPLIMRPFDYLFMISVAGMYSINRLNSHTRVHPTHQISITT